MERVGNFRKELFPSSRVPSLDILYEGMQKHHIKALMEIDVSEARQSIKMWSEKHGEKLSFTAWVIFCIGQAAGKFPESHAARKGKNIIYFQDVDVSMIIERDVNGKLVPLPYVVRKANEKTVFQIHQEIRSAQNQPANVVVLGANPGQKYLRFYAILPHWLRHFVWQRILGNAFNIKKNMGTVVITAIGMFGKGVAWPIPIGIHPLEIAVGTIYEKPWNVNGSIMLREILHLTVMFDHDVIDGGPAARFLGLLNELLSIGFGLEAT